MSFRRKQSDKVSFASVNEKERFQLAADGIQIDIINITLEKMRKLGLSKADIAKKLGVSRSYVSQLFSCDKRMNLITLAKLESILHTRFVVSASYSERYDLSLVEQIRESRQSFDGPCVQCHYRPYTEAPDSHSEIPSGRLSLLVG
ncbi:MAG: helix-turn-helix transcriptional regulator [Alkalispirochaeta sp.]